jgi:hypothetical protein
LYRYNQEHRDMRAVNEVIVQFLAYRKLDALNSTASLEDVHFTMNFFDFPSATSRPCRLTPPDAKPGEPQLLVGLHSLPGLSDFEDWLHGP